MSWVWLPKRKPRTNDEILLSLRRDLEYENYTRSRSLWLGGCIPIRPDLLIPPLTANQILKTCNKSVALYYLGTGGPGFAPLHDVVYRLWDRQWRSDIEFGRFPATLIHTNARVPNSHVMSPPPTVQDIVKVHKELCATVDSSDVANQDLPSDQLMDYFDRKQANQFHIKPLFRALLLILEADAPPDQPPKVRLVCTGDEGHLGKPLDLAGIEQQAEISSDSSGDTVITTDLVTALQFVDKLDREQALTDPSPQDPDQIDAWIGDLNKLARERGYTGDTIVRPSSTWVRGNPYHRPLTYLTPVQLLSQLGVPVDKDELQASIPYQQYPVYAPRVYASLPKASFDRAKPQSLD